MTTNTEQLLAIVASTGLVDDISAFDAEKTFKNNGIDSLDVMTLLLAFEEGLGVTFNEDEANRIHSLKDVMGVLAERA
jgi:acyl carrier protein